MFGKKSTLAGWADALSARASQGVLYVAGSAQLTKASRQVAGETPAAWRRLQQGS
jgi:hypothetical protein